MTSQTTQKRQLKMDPNLLLDVIGRQAGTLDKAVLEGGMNGIEAINAVIQDKGSCEDEGIYITFKKGRKDVLTIQDYGKGITTKKEIEEFFETFGTPHAENEHKIYAQFRMGRGQMFNFGRNVWRTGTFKLIVDIMRNGLEWELEENLPFVSGCHIEIELYDKYKNSWPANTVDCLKDAVKKQMEFVSSPVYFNGEQISTPPKDLTWDEEDDFAYYSFGVGDSLKIYNLGVYVRDNHRTSGIIVSKQQLRVNFPRNDVMADCVIWYHIEKVVKKNVVNRSKKKYIALTKHERRAILKDIRNGIQEYQDVKTSRILQTAQNKYISFSMFLKNNQPWTFAHIGSRQADTLIEQGSHVVFAKEMIEALNYSGEEKDFFSWLIKTLLDGNEKYGEQSWQQYNDYPLQYDYKKILAKEKFYDNFCHAVSNMSSSCITLAQNKLTKVEKRVIQSLTYYSCWDARVLRMGVSDSASAWTDGHSHITLDRKFLKRLNLTVDSDIVQLFTVLVHELAHNDDTSNTDIHGEDFYESFHAICLKNCWGNPLNNILKFKKSMDSLMSAERRDKRKKQEEDNLQKQAEKLGLTKKTNIHDKVAAVV